MTPPLHALASATLASEPTVSLGDSAALVVIAILVCAVVLGVLTAALAVYRYRQRADPALRALVVGLVLVAVAPLPFRLYAAGSIDPVLRELAPPVLQTAGLAAILYAMYGDPRSRTDPLRDVVTRADLVVVAGALAMAATTAVLVIAVVCLVVATGTFVAAQAARAAVRYRSITMASLAAGVVLLVVLPTPLGALLLTTGVVSTAIVLAALSASILLGEAAMLATLASR
jgi:hypothetical protein